MLALPALRKLKKKMDPRMYNGAMFLGLNGVSVKSHGGADAFAFSHAVSTAISLAQNDLCRRIKKELEHVLEYAPAEDSSR